MHINRRPRKARYVYSMDTAASRRGSGKVGALLLFTGGLLLLFFAAAALFLRNISTDIAVSDASDVLTMKINSTIAEVMEDGGYAPDYFVTMEKNDRGEVTAVSANMAHINALSAEILARVSGSAENDILTVEIPCGNLSGLSLLMGRGPKVPVKLIMLTSSGVEFNNSIVTAGINQTKHQISLDVIIDADVLVPWGKRSTQVRTQVLIADTIVVGQVPGTYLSIGE